VVNPRPALIASGESTTLAWQVTNADTVEINQCIGSVNATSGSPFISEDCQIPTSD